MNSRIIRIDLLAKERRALTLRKTEIGKETANKGERRDLVLRKDCRDHKTTGCWTAVLKYVRPSIRRIHGVVGFYPTQLLGDRGYFHVVSPEHLRLRGAHLLQVRKAGTTKKISGVGNRFISPI